MCNVVDAVQELVAFLVEHVLGLGSHNLERVLPEEQLAGLPASKNHPAGLSTGNDRPENSDARFGARPAGRCDGGGRSGGENVNFLTRCVCP